MDGLGFEDLRKSVVSEIAKDGTDEKGRRKDDGYGQCDDHLGVASPFTSGCQPRDARDGFAIGRAQVLWSSSQPQCPSEALSLPTWIGSFRAETETTRATIRSRATRHRN